MNINDIFNPGGQLVENPNYTPTNGQPKYIMSTTPASESKLAGLYRKETGRGLLDKLGNTKDFQKYMDYGITPNDWETNLDAQLADAQSNWSKTFNALSQTLVSEIGLGTVKGISDLFDFVINLGISSNNDYTNPVSAKLQEWQDIYNNQVAPVHVTPDTNIANGGLTNWGWWMSNIPSVASSLTLLVPAMGVTKGLSMLGKTTQIFNGLGKARRFLTSVDKVDEAIKSGKKLNELQKLSLLVNNESLVGKANELARIGTTAFTSRIMENYQEANQVYNDLLPVMYHGDKSQNITGIKDMSDDDYNNFVNKNKQILEGVNTNDRLAVAKRLAKAGADRTFQDDMVNGIFDVIELYALRNFTKAINAPMRASVRRSHLNSIRYPGKTKEQVEEILGKRRWYQKATDKTEDYLFGSTTAIAGQLSEGVEEAVNYVAQEEGMRYGHVLLSGIQDEPFDRRLAEYIKNPNLYDSAFWGVMGGVVFQGVGSYLGRVRNAIETKSREKKFKDEKAGTDIPTTSWKTAMTDWEVQSRVKDVDSRYEANKILSDELKLINEQHVNPWVINQGNHPALSSEEVSIARRKAIRKRNRSLLMNSMFNGNFNITRAYIESEEVKRGLVEAGLISEEDANIMQQDAIALANKIEDSYSRNLRAVGNAMRNIDKSKYDEIPIEYYQIIAAENMTHEFEAEDYDDAIAQYQPEINSEQERIKNELAKSGIDYKRVVRSYILAQQLGEINAELKESKKRLKENRAANANDPRTISGQSAIQELKLRKQVLTDMINAEIATEKLNPLASVISIVRASAATERLAEGGYRMNEKNETYKAIDKAITDALDDTINFEDAIKALKDISGINFTGTREAFKEGVHQANVFDENVKIALSNGKEIKNLNNLSKSLTNAYAQVTYNEIARNIERSHIATTADEVKLAAFNKYNQQNAVRMLAVEQATDTLKRLAKQLNDEYGDVSHILAYGTTETDSRNQLKRMLTAEEMKIYDDAMRLLVLNDASVTGRRGKINGENYRQTNLANASLPQILERAINESRLDNFEDVDELEDEAETETKEETEKNSTVEKNLVEEPKKSSTKESTETASKSSSKPKKGQIKDFNYNKANKRLLKPVANLIFNDDNAVVELDNFDITSDNPNVYLFPINEENGEYALDFKQEVQENEGIENTDTYNNTSLFTIYPNEDTLNGGVVRQNPKLVVDKEGNVISFSKGIIARPETPIDNVDESDSWIYQSSSTGGLDGKSGKDEIDEKDETDGIDEESKRIDDENKKADEEQVNEDEVYDKAREDTSKTFIFAAVRSIKAGETYDESAIETELRKKYESLDSDFVDDIINKSKTAAKNYLRRNSKEFKDVVEFADDASSITDEMIGTDAEKEALKRLEKSFANVISNFKRHAIVDNYKGKQVVSLENLLRYINSVVGDSALSNYLYDSIVEELKNNDKYIIREEFSDYSFTGKNKGKTKTRILSDATRTTNERIITSSDVNGRSIDFNHVINNLDKKEREEVYKTIEQLNIGDKLDYNVIDAGNTYVVEFKVNGRTIGSAPVPRINGSPKFTIKEGDKFTSVKKGWIVDIPIDKTGTSNFKQMIIELALNPDNDKDIAKLNEMLIDASYLRRGSDEYKKACKELTKAIVNHYGKITKSNILAYSINDAEDKELITSGEHILNIYNDMALASEQTLVAADISREQYADMIKDARLASINNWFEKLFNSDSNVFALAKNPNLTIRVDTINEGGLIITDRKDAKPVNQKGVIGSNYTGRLELAVSSLFNPGKIVFTGNNEAVNNPSIGAGNTFVAIPKKNGSFALVHAFPREISAHIIGKDISNEFSFLLNDWANGRISTSEIKRFIDRLCNTSENNVPLCKGFKCDNLTGGYNGIQIQYVDENNNKQYIKLFETNKYSDKVTVISFPNEKAYSIHSAENRAKAITKLKDIAEKALKYNISTQIIEGNATAFNMSFATFNADGQYVVKLPNGTEHTFSSYKSFIIDNGLVNVTTESRNGRTNFINPNESETSFDRPIITFTEASSNPPVEKGIVAARSTLLDSNTNVAIGDKVKDYIKANGRTDIVGEEILNIVLTGTQLNSLKKSRLFSYMPLGNIIFVENLGTKQNPAIASHITRGRIIDGVKLNAGDIAVSQRWIDLLNSDNIETRFEAVRHLIHEGVHRHLTTLSEEQKDKLFNGVEEVYNAFVKANEEENLTAFDVFKYAGNSELKRKYYTNGKLNRKGLEEFLVESITRPVLMERLNEISEDGKKITAQKVGNVKSKSLLQKILALIADMFNVKVNRGSLLAKEYKLFNDIITEAKQNIKVKPATVSTTETLATEERREENQIEQTVTTEEETETESATEEQISGIEDEYGVDDDSIFPDNTISSLNDFRDSLIKENRDAFKNLVNSGGIQIIC